MLGIRSTQGSNQDDFLKSRLPQTKLVFFCNKVTGCVDINSLEEQQTSDIKPHRTLIIHTQ